MNVEIVLPPLGDDAPDAASVSFFYFEVGDEVAKDADLVEMITDKASFNMPCPESGTLKQILVAEGDEVKVGQPIAILEAKP